MTTQTKSERVQRSDEEWVGVLSGIMDGLNIAILDYGCDPESYEVCELLSTAWRDIYDARALIEKASA